MLSPNGPAPAAAAPPAQGMLGKLTDEFTARDCKVVGITGAHGALGARLSASAICRPCLASHPLHRAVQDIDAFLRGVAETQGARVAFPVVADASRAVSTKVPVPAPFPRPSRHYSRSTPGMTTHHHSCLPPVAVPVLAGGRSRRGPQPDGGYYSGRRRRCAAPRCAEQPSGRQFLRDGARAGLTAAVRATRGACKRVG